ncbi:hypothetical protein Dole_0072 [Desulfosudis oleivorans Hxd3]|uniref:Uncharacterized protein n=2 Tax=Desulfosudis TaxID=2904716 RepID=A8ZRW5_DESOH|nr:hypothetical protein Dole_0072 [Desulfosudis oleivorans Hxd3]
MFIMFATAVRADKSGAMDKFLTDKDRAVIAQRVLAGTWYPFETYKNCFTAVARVVAKDNPETLREWGRQYGEATMTSIYKIILQKKDARSAMTAYNSVFKSQFDFGKTEFKMVSDSEILIGLIGFDQNFTILHHVAQGWMERTIQLVINKPVRSEIAGHNWEGTPAVVFRLRW